MFGLTDFSLSYYAALKKVRLSKTASSLCADQQDERCRHYSSDRGASEYYWLEFL